MTPLCTKTVHPTKKAARKAAKRINRAAGMNVEAFLCKDCKRWHVGLKLAPGR